MGLSKVSIGIENGNIGAPLTLDDGVSAIIVTAVSNANIVLGTSYAVTSLKNAEDTLGIDSTGVNAFLHKVIKDYYTTLGSSATLYVMPVVSTVSMEGMLDKDNDYVKNLQVKAQGKIRLIAVSRKSSGTETTANGLDVDVDKAMIKGQAIADIYRGKMQPFNFIVDAKNYTGVATDLKDYNTASYNHGSLFIMNDKGVTNNRVGLILGELSKQPVQRRISRVKNGAIPITTQPYIGNKTVEESEDNLDMLHDKGYIFLRSFQGKSGYYFSSDRTATSTTDDYASLSKSRVINKAVLVAYKTYVDELNDEISLTDEGKISPPLIIAYQRKIESAIEINMSEAISNIRAVIDSNQNIATTDVMKVALRIVPLGYLGEIEVSLGFEIIDNK